MRIMIDNETIIETPYITAIPTWREGGESSEENPEMYAIKIVMFGDAEILGTYNLDDTIETYNAAVKNFEEICEKLLTKGYCRLSDFKNFEAL